MATSIKFTDYYDSDDVHGIWWNESGSITFSRDSYYSTGYYFYKKIINSVTVYALYPSNTLTASINVASHDKLYSSKTDLNSNRLNASEVSTAYCTTVASPSSMGSTSPSSFNYLSGYSSAQTISATPSATQYRFVSWSDGGAQSHSVTPSGDTTYTATFEQYKWKLEAESENEARGYVQFNGWSNGAYVESGDTESVTARPAANYRFIGWYLNDVLQSTSATFSITGSTVDRTYVAKFAATQIAITTSVTPTSSGEISLYIDEVESSSGDTAIEPNPIRIVSSPAYGYIFEKLTFDGDVGQSLGASEIVDDDYTFNLDISDEMANESDVSITAVFEEETNRTLDLDKENDSYGTISVEYTYGGTTTTLEETANEISLSAYNGVTYTLKAELTDSDLYKFDGWYLSGESEPYSTEPLLELLFSDSSTDTIEMTAKFSAKPLYSLTPLFSDGNDTYPGDGSGSEPSGMETARVTVNTTPDSGSDFADGRIVSLTATVPDGYYITSWQITHAHPEYSKYDYNIDDQPPGTTEVLSITHTIQDDVTIIVTLKKQTYTFEIDVEATAEAASADDTVEMQEIVGFTDVGSPYTAEYGEIILFYASANAGYTFAGWFDAVTDEPAPDSIIGPLTYEYTDSSYYVEADSDVSLVAKFKATVTVAVDLTGSATGTVTIDEETPGASVNKDIILGETCTITATATSGYFDAWYVTDTPLGDPIPGYTAEYEITVTDTTSLTAKLLETQQTFYIALLNYDNDTDTEDEDLGIFTITGDTANLTEKTKDQFEAIMAGSSPSGSTPDVPGNKYYQVTGTSSLVIRANPATSKQFVDWDKADITAETSPPPDYNIGSKSAYSTVNPLTLLVNSSMVLYANYGDPANVNLRVRFASGNNITNGSFSALPEGDDYESVANGGFNDVYEQGTSITLRADVMNGYLFDGWYRDEALTDLASSDTEYTFTINATTWLYAKYSQDTDAIYKWQGSTTNKMATWRSKRYVSTRPVDMGCARLYASAYPLTLRLFNSSSPDSPSASTASQAVLVRNQNGMRLPMTRPEKYIEIEVQHNDEVSELAVSTSMQGLIG